MTSLYAPVMTAPPSVKLITPTRHEDARGWFSEVYVEERWSGLGVNCRFVQDNHSYSAPPFALRGLHFQVPPHAQAKLVRCVRGHIFDVVVDVRAGSPTYGQWVGAKLSAKNGRQIFVPVGFAHGFLTLEPDCEVVYKVSHVYAPEADGGVRWDTAGVDWPLPPNVRPELSVKDERLPALSEFASPFAYDGHPLGPFEQD